MIDASVRILFVAKQNLRPPAPSALSNTLIRGRMQSEA
jgi:hypothetical protein